MFGKTTIKRLMMAALAIGATCSIATQTVVFALPVAASASFEDGVKFYNQANYKQALIAFTGYLKSNQRSAAAYLYIANSYYALRQISAAKQTYQIVITNFPNSNEALTARNFLQRLEPANSASKSTTSAENLDAAAQSSAKARSSSDPVPQLNLRIIRPVVNHPPVSPTLIATVQAKLASYPKSVKQMLSAGRIEVVLTPTLIDKNPELKNQEGRGYDGHTYKSCPGMFDGREIVICERTVDENTEAVHDAFSTKDILNTLNHECGHAIDSCMGDISESDQFKHTYLLDAAAAQRLDASVSRDLAYYLQKSVAGQQECCGELFGIILGTEGENSDKMKAAFPQTIKLLRAKLGL